MTAPIPLPIPQPLPDNRVRFDKTISLGHVFSVCSFVVIALAQWNMLDKRVLVLEESRTTQRERDVAQDTATREKAQEVKDALADLKRSVEKLTDRVTQVTQNQGSYQK